MKYRSRPPDLAMAGVQELQGRPIRGRGNIFRRHTHRSRPHAYSHGSRQRRLAGPRRLGRHRSGYPKLVRLVIVGATGNLGSALLRRLRDEGGHETVGVTRRAPGPDPLFDKLHWHSIDVGAPDAESALRAVFAGADAVVNLAWGFQPGRDVAYLERIGVGGTRAVVAAARGAGVPHLVQMSSVGAYRAAGRGTPVDEQWPVDGVPASVYSVHKAAAEALLDDHERTGAAPLVARMRPGLVMQRSAAGSLLRYGAPGWFPARGIDLIPLLPFDRTFAVPVVHADDVATAISAALARQATGPFNLAAASPLTALMLADVLRAKLVHVPWSALRAVVAAGWALRLQRLDPGWIDLAFSVPLLKTDRAQDVLGWTPTRDAEAILRELIAGIRDQAAGPGPVLRHRAVLADLAKGLHHGPITRRREP